MLLISIWRPSVSYRTDSKVIVIPYPFHGSVYRDADIIAVSISAETGTVPIRVVVPGISGSVPSSVISSSAVLLLGLIGARREPLTGHLVDPILPGGISVQGWVPDGPQ